MPGAVPYAGGRPGRQPLRGPPSPSSLSMSSSSGEESGGGGGGGGGGYVRAAVEETAVVVVGRRGCCMGHVAKRLLQGLGVNPAAWEVVGEAEELALRAELGEMALAGGIREWPVTLPAVFIGGRLLGGLDHLMAVHISGNLVPILKEAGALWL